MLAAIAVGAAANADNCLAEDAAQLNELLDRAEVAAKAGCSQIEPVVTADGRVKEDPALRAMSGFAALARTNGGTGQRLFRVTTTEDYDPALPPERGTSGSLRAALQRARNEGGGFVLLDAALGTSPHFALRSQLPIFGNVTVEGGCVGALLTTPANTPIFVVRGANVILRNLKMSRPHARLDDDQGDCVTVYGDFDRLWIDHNDFGSCGDGQVDITRPEPRQRERRVTISHNVFHDHNHVMLVEAQGCRVTTREPQCPDLLGTPQLAAPEIFLSLHANVFRRTASRHPEVMGNVFLHVTNNIIAFENLRYSDGRVTPAYGIFAGNGARVLAHDNLIYQARRQAPNRPMAIWTRGTPEAITSFAPPGAMRAEGTLTARVETVDQHRPELVETLPSGLLLPRIDFVQAGVARAVHCIIAMAGPGRTSGPRQECLPRFRARD